jgi:acetyl-CoA C-acetyltransferase
MTGICIVGWAHTPFGKLPDPDTESLIAQVAGPAIQDAGIAASEIDGIFVGQFNSGFSKQDFPSSLTLQGIPSLRFKPAMRCENACASGAAAVFAGIDFIRSGRGKAVLVVGAEKMTAATGAEVASNLLGASYRREEAGVAGGFAGMATW